MSYTNTNILSNVAQQPKRSPIDGVLDRCKNALEELAKTVQDAKVHFGAVTLPANPTPPEDKSAKDCEQQSGMLSTLRGIETSILNAVAELQDLLRRSQL